MSKARQRSLSFKQQGYADARAGFPMPNCKRHPNFKDYKAGYFEGKAFYPQRPSWEHWLSSRKRFYDGLRLKG